MLLIHCFFNAFNVWSFLCNAAFIILSSLQSFGWGRESWLFYLKCVQAVLFIVRCAGLLWIILGISWSYWLTFRQFHHSDLITTISCISYCLIVVSGNEYHGSNHFSIFLVISWYIVALIIVLLFLKLFNLIWLLTVKMNWVCLEAIVDFYYIWTTTCDFQKLWHFHNCRLRRACAASF